MNHIRLLRFAALAILCIATASQADTGLDAYRRGDFATAAAAWREAAGRGDAFAQFQMGYLFETGKGVTMSRDEAQRWYTVAHQQGYTPAARALDRMSSMPEAAAPTAIAGTAPPPRSVTPIPLPRPLPISSSTSGAPPAAPAGKGPICVEAQAALASHPRHKTLAQGWCAAADAGDPQALYALGHVFASIGVFQRDQVFKLAEKYWTAAMNADHVHARTALGVFYARNGEGSAFYPEAVRLLQVAADASHPIAMYNLGALRYNGKAVPQDIPGALKAWMRAAELGSLQATLAMAWEYCAGQNVRADLARGENLLATVRRLEPRIGRSTCVEWGREPTPWGQMSYDYPSAGFDVPFGG